MGAGNFFVGWGARETNPLLMRWFLDVFFVIISFGYLSVTKTIKKTYNDFRKNKKVLLSMCFFDNAAWTAFVFALALAPIAIAVSISESYIIIAVLLGMYANKERLRYHQKAGLILAITSAIWLAITMG